jgi:hypothetical protein
MFGGKLPHEFGRLPLTYFQTLVENTYTSPKTVSPTRNDSGDDDGVELVDVDELIRKGRRNGFGVQQ